MEMQIEDLIALLIPSTLVAVILDVQDSAGSHELIAIRNLCRDALISLVGERKADEMAPLATPYLDHGIIAFIEPHDGNTEGTEQ